MTAPALSQFQNGISQVSGDNLETFNQTCNVVADLRGFIGTAGMQVYLRGYTAVNDGGQGQFYWNVSGTGPDDGGVTIVVPSGAAVGCWSRLNSIVTLANGKILVGNSSNVATAVTMSGDATLANTGAITVTKTSGTAFTAAATATTGQLPATATNDSAAAGKVGEYIFSFVLQASAVSLSNGIAANITSISLTAGDWDVYSMISDLPANTTVMSYLYSNISTTSVTISSNDFSFSSWTGSVTGNGSTFLVALPAAKRISVSTTTTVYAVAQSAFTTSTNIAWGGLWARRAR